MDADAIGISIYEGPDYTSGPMAMGHPPSPHLIPLIPEEWMIRTSGTYRMHSLAVS